MTLKVNLRTEFFSIKPVAALGLLLGCSLFGADKLYAQGRDWMTSNVDAQRSGWVRTDNKIANDKVGKDFQLLWKMKLNNKSNQLNALTPPATLERLIGYRGFRMLGFLAGSNNTLFTIDTDLARMEWEKQLKVTAPPAKSTLNCPGGITNGIARPTLTAIAGAPTGPIGGGRSNPAKSAVGSPGAGAVTLANVRPNPPAPPAPPPAAANATPRPSAAAPPGGQFGRGPFLVYALAGDGMLHAMHLSNGADYEAPVKFLPPNANSHGLIVTDNYAYAVTEQNCSGVANGLWAIDLASKQVTSWKANIVGSSGPSFSGDGTIFVTTGSGGASANSLVALDPKTLSVKSAFSAGDQSFVTSPVIFEYKNRTLVAAATKDGRVHIFDSTNLQSPLTSSAANGDAPTASLASWQDRDGTRWLLAPLAKTVVAWKVTEQGSGVSLQSGWTSRELIAPLAPTVIGNVAFLVSSGEFRGASNVSLSQRVKKSVPAVIYAVDAATGKELWNSGKTITSFTHGGAISGGMGQIYLTTYDNTLYAFGFPMEH